MRIMLSPSLISLYLALRARRLLYIDLARAGSARNITSSGPSSVTDTGCTQTTRNTQLLTLNTSNVEKHSNQIAQITDFLSFKQ